MGLFTWLTKKEVVRRKTCYTCKARFTYTPSEVKSDYGGSYVNCPSCRTLILVSDDFEF